MDDLLQLPPYLPLLHPPRLPPAPSSLRAGRSPSPTHPTVAGWPRRVRVEARLAASARTRQTRHQPSLVAEVAPQNSETTPPASVARAITSWQGQGQTPAPPSPPAPASRGDRELTMSGDTEERGWTWVVIDVMLIVVDTRKRVFRSLPSLTKIAVSCDTLFGETEGQLLTDCSSPTYCRRFKNAA